MSADFLADAQWRVVGVAAGTWVHPDDIPAETSWEAAVVPGTVASAFAEMGQGGRDLDEFDWWFRVGAAVSADLPTTLTFDGIATRATIWVDGIESGRIRSMFAPESIDVPATGSDVDIVVRVESLAAHLKKRRPRGRWRSSLIAQQGLRHERTTLLGRAPVYGPLPTPVGLWRPAVLRARPDVENIRITTGVDGSNGSVRVRARARGASSVELRVGDRSFPIPVEDGEIDSTVTVPDVALWWPHTHGDPVLYPWSIECEGRIQGSGSVGFRTVELLRSGSSVVLQCNGVRVFARGGCWVPPDPVRLWVDEERMRSELTRVRDAGLNMVRVVGTMVYEQAEFWSLCSQLGIMVWQDVMTATTDPPEDAEFVELVDRELAALAALVGGNPALTVVSGGSETQQQPTMLGVANEGMQMSLLQRVIPELLESELPGTPYVTSSPSSTMGEAHTHVGDGIAHYFGIGGYLRPLTDVLTARVRFAAECLAFAVPPERRAVDAMFGGASVAGHHPDWKAAVPRDRGSSWDFEDVRDHYVRDIFGVDPHLVRRDDAELYLDYGRAAVCEAVTAAYTQWRRSESECTGALVLTLRDLVPGAGWGLIDSAGAVKAPWYSLARVSSPVAVLVVDDGLDGLTLEIVSDRPAALTATVRLGLHGQSEAVGETHEYAVSVEPHGATRLSVDTLVGRFTDVNHAYRFGTRTYAAVTVDLIDDTGVVLAEATHLIDHRHARQNDVGLGAVLEPVEHGVWTLTVSTRWAAQYVCVDVDGFEVSDSWFHLAPGGSRTLTLTGDRPTPTGHVRALNSTARARIG